MKVNRRIHSKEFKDQAVQFVKTIDKPVSEIATATVPGTVFLEVAEVLVADAGTLPCPKGGRLRGRKPLIPGEEILEGWCTVAIFA